MNKPSRAKKRASHRRWPQRRRSAASRSRLGQCPGRDHFKTRQGAVGGWGAVRPSPRPTSRATTKTSASGCCRISRAAPARWCALPNGVGTEQFFQRHASAGMSDLLTSVKVRGDKAPYVQIDRIEALAAAAQVAALEFHPWNCAPGNPEVAGRLVFDLDPAPDVGFEAVIAGAIEIRDRLKATGLESFCKTTGGKGLHVVAPLSAGKAAVAWPVAKNFAHIICAQMVQDSPNKYLDTMSKQQRSGRSSWTTCAMTECRRQSRCSRRARATAPRCPCRFIGRTFAAAWRR